MIAKKIPASASKTSASVAAVAKAATPLSAQAAWPYPTGTASQTGLVGAAKPAPAPKLVVRKGVASVKTSPVKKAPAQLSVSGGSTGVSTRKSSIQTVQNGVSSRKDTEKTVPVVVMRRLPNGTAQRLIVNFIRANETTQRSSDARSMKIASVGGAVFGTNLGPQVDLRKARCFIYTPQHLLHGKDARHVMPWFDDNQKAVEALHILGFITAYELEFHNKASQTRKDQEDRKNALAAKKKSQTAELQAMTKSVRNLLNNGMTQAQVITALRKGGLKASQTW